mgnify:CR=1 FL=1
MTLLKCVHTRTKLICLLILLNFGCGEEEDVVREEVTYAKPDPSSYANRMALKEAPDLLFVDKTEASGINFRHENGVAGQKWMPETMGSGCALFDYDGDEDLDLFLVNSKRWDGAGDSRSKFYANNGDGTFIDVSKKVGLDIDSYAMGATVADYDADGDLDVYLTTLGSNILLRNDNGFFVDVSDRAGVAGQSWVDSEGNDSPEWSTGAGWADVDGDEWLDLLVTNYVRWSPSTDIYTSLDGKQKSYATPQQYQGSTPRLYRNLGDGTFEDITEKAGLFLDSGKSMGVSMTDFEEDGLIDWVVTNDTQPNFLLHNLGNGRFEERGLMAGIGYDDTGRARAGMGVDVASVSNDGVKSIAIGNFSREALSLYKQIGDVFVDAAGKAKLVQSTLRPLTFGLKFLDVDLDGFQDLVLANGHIEPEINSVQKEIFYLQSPQLFWNDQDGKMIDISNAVGPIFSEEMVARGLAVGDIDGDGDTDIIFTTNGGPAYVVVNESPVGNAVAVDLRMNGGNRRAIGASVEIIANGLTQKQMVRTGSSYLSHSATTLTFGIGVSTSVDRMTVRWPDGFKQELLDLSAGRRYLIVYKKGIAGEKPFVMN